MLVFKVFERAKETLVIFTLPPEPHFAPTKKSQPNAAHKHDAKVLRDKVR